MTLNGVSHRAMRNTLIYLMALYGFKAGLIHEEMPGFFGDLLVLYWCLTAGWLGTSAITAHERMNADPRRRERR